MRQFIVGFSLGKKAPPESLSAIVCLASALIPLWPRPHTLSAMCLPCVRHVSAVFVCAWLPFVRHVSALCPPCARLVSATCPLWPRLQTFALRHCVCLVCVCVWPAEARPRHHEVKFSQQCGTHRVYIACPLVNFLGIHFVSANSASASTPCA